MYLDDAQDVAQPRKIQEQPKLDPKLVAWYQERKGGAGHTVGPRGTGYVGVCRWIDGYHVCYDYGGYCPRVESWTGGEPREILFTRRVG